MPFKKDIIENLPHFRIGELDTQKTAVVMIDMINGFLKSGNLHNREALKIVPDIKVLLEYAKQSNMKTIAFADSHSKKSVEFEVFPKHCINGTGECEIIDELSETGGFTLIRKNSTNGFHAHEFRRFLDMNGQLENFVVCGVCTDICVMNFCLTLKSYFDNRDRKSRVILPVNMTCTANGDVMKTAACVFMKNCGTELFGGIDFD